MIHEVRLTPFDAAAVLIALAALLGYVNHRFIKVPASVALTVMGALASLLVIGLDRLLPGSTVGADLTRFIARIDFHETLMNGMLSFLLFAGALHVDWPQMKRGRWPILMLSTVGVLLSTAIVGFGLYAIAGALGLSVPLIWALVFGALISPTDPVSVMGVLKRTSVTPVLEATVAGESLFNDGVGVVVFAILLATALSGAPFSLATAGQLFLIEAGGGVLLGLAIGGIGFRMMRSIDDYKVEVMISLAVVMGGYALAKAIHVSGPVAMAVAGLLIGNAGVAYAMSDVTREYLLKFWSLIDDILNAVLFLLIGLEVVTIPADSRLLLLGLLAVPLALAARALSVLLPLALLRPLLDLGRLAPPTLIWGGLRGGISIALALSLTSTNAPPGLLAATYLVVLFSVVVQGGTIERVLRYATARLPAEAEPRDAG